MDGLRKAIAIDFDGCLCTDAFPAIGEPNWPVIYRAKAEQRAGAGLILWTCREGQILQDAIAACEGWGLTFDSINESLPDWIEVFGTRPRKIGASEYWDDKAVQIPLPPNPPLTLDELREMNGEPVWTITIGLEGSGRWELCTCEVGTACPLHKVFRCVTATGEVTDYELDTYGKTWLAYHSKPRR